ncbi:MAG TPA: deoxyribodipyrimidine photo-lyase [Pseudomonadales bacterium]|jgi:deoxyribodipyrimidine photo-lyase
MRSIVWFRNDLRVTDNPALVEACARGEVTAVTCLCPAQLRAHDVGPMRIAFLLRSLGVLSHDLASIGVSLKIIERPRFADLPEALVDFARQEGATHLEFNDEYPLDERRRDAEVADACAAAGIVVGRHVADCTLSPGTVLTNSGSPYTVFSPFRRRWLERVDRAQLTPMDAPRRRPGKGAGDPVPVTLDGVGAGLGEDLWPAGEAAAQKALKRFLSGPVLDYGDTRDSPALDATSRLSPYLAIGAISVNQCLHAAVEANGGRLDGRSEGISKWITELIWREFYRHIVALFPHVSQGKSFRRELDALEWRDAPEDYEAWKAGETGYPLVDAAMRQLNETGWMHNRLRMVTAMFLTKHLLLDWRLGERYFMEKLVDGDFASNNGGWQWSASTGTDAAPYFRILNPTTQGQRFDADGAFTRRMLPVLADVPDKWLFEPKRFDADLGYPDPIVEHRAARARALALFKN